MFRTRDFVLFLITIAFLLVAIGSTLVSQKSGAVVSEESVKFAEVTNQEHSAAVFVPAGLSRSERVEDMRQKIAASGSLTLTAPSEIQNGVSGNTADEDISTLDEIQADVQYCSGYLEQNPFWSASGLQFDVVEGSRIVFREIISEYELDTKTATSGTVVPPEIKREVLLQLPIPTLPTSKVACLSGDVIGIAQDGSLIRNNEAGLYGVFGAGTLIGYALDGFPIHGVSNSASDTCGGMVVGGQYGYYLSAERETVINCFSGIPVTI